MNKLLKMSAAGAGRIATGLGWFSIILGLVALVAPRRTAHAIGVRKRPLLFRLIGLREIASGLGLMRSPKKAGWLWSRVGGDAMDLALLGTAFSQRGTRPGRLGAVTAGVAGVTILDALGAWMNTPRGPLVISDAITVNRSPEVVYQVWRKFTNLPNFMLNLQSVRELDAHRSRWVTKSPLGRNLEWDAEITEDLPNERIAWKTVGEADVPHSGSVEFKPAPGDRGTMVVVRMQTEPLPMGSGRIASLFKRAPQLQLSVDLHRFEQWLETGSVITTEGQPAAGRTYGTSKTFDVTATREAGTLKGVLR